MNDVIQIVLGSTLFGTLITSLANLAVSYRVMKSTITLENKKLLTAFRMRNLDLLRELRAKAEAGFTVKPVVEAMNQQDQHALAQCAIESNSKTRLRISEYRKYQSCFRRSSRAELDAAVNKVESVDYYVGGRR